MSGDRKEGTVALLIAPLQFASCLVSKELKMADATFFFKATKKKGAWRAIVIQNMLNM